MKLTKVKRRELKRGDMFCVPYVRKSVSEIYVVVDDSDDTIDSVSTMDVLRIDAPDYTHALTQFSWKLKHLDDMVCGMQLVGDEVERLQRENEKLSATIDNVRVAMRKRGSVVAIQAVNQTIYEHDHSEDDTQCDHDEKLAVDSVVLDEIISVVRDWNHDRRGGHVPMIKIAKIIEERGD